MVVYKTAVTLNTMERDAILGWLEYSREDSFHYGGAALADPEQDAIARILRETPPDRRCIFTDQHVMLMRDWMEKSLGRKYGPARYATPAEQSVYDKITRYLTVPQEAQVEDP